MAPEQILHYRIERKLGEGGMGAVFLATDTKLGRKVAIKILSPEQATDPESRQRFIHEAKAEAMLNHPNIVTFYEVGEAEGQAFIVMEYVDGQTLSEFVQSEKLSLNQILDLVTQVGEGLQAAHEKGVVHRDIKPDNIMVTPKGKVKITDFGLARWKGATTITKTGTRMGTAFYMSPEQAEGRKLDHRSDIFSLGVILYELLCRQRPFTGDTEAVVLYEILNTQPQPLARFCRDVPDDMERIVRKCLSKDVDERYQSAADLVADLKHQRRGLSSVISSEATTVPSARRKERRGWIVSASVVALVVVALVFKPWKITVEPTNEVAAVQNRLAIMYFDNLADPDDEKRLGEIAANLLITDLSETPNLDVISNQRLYDLLKQLGHEGSKRIDRDVASQVAKMARARWMFLGSILQTEPQLIITAQLVDVSTGNTVASQKVEGKLDENIFAVVDRLTVEVKSDLALPESAQASFDPIMAEVTTSSPEAYRLYLEGVELNFQYRGEKARERFREAVAIDSTFAAVYFEWSKFSGKKESIRLSKLAMRYADHASPRQRDMIKAHYVFVVEENPRKAIGLCRDILEKYPNEVTVLMGTFFAYSRLHHKDSALLALEELVELDPLFKQAYNEMAYKYQEVGNFDRSIWAINKYIEIAPDEPNPYDTRGDLYSFEGMLDEAKASFAQALTIDPEFTLSRAKLGLMYMIFPRKSGQVKKI